MVVPSAGAPTGPSWLTSTKLVYQKNFATSSIIQSYDVGTTATATLDSQGGNDVAGGGGIWGAWLAKAGVGVRSNVPGATSFPNSLLGDVSEDGELVVIGPSQVGITVYSAAGATILSLPGVTVVGTSSRVLATCRDHLLLYIDKALGWQMKNVIGGAFSFRPRINETINWAVPVTTSQGKTLIVEVSSRITVRYADRPNGWQLQPLGTLTFNPDIIELSAGVLRIGWSANAGESADALMLMDLTLATGATRVGTVSGGVVVWATGPTLPPMTFDVGPLQGSDTGGVGYPPIRHPVTDDAGIMTKPWVAYQQKQTTDLAGATSSIAALPTPVPPGPSFGIVTSDLGAPVAAQVADDTFFLGSADGSLQVTGDAGAKKIDLSAVAGSSGLSPLFAAVSLRA